MKQFICLAISIQDNCNTKRKMKNWLRLRLKFINTNDIKTSLQPKNIILFNKLILRDRLKEFIEQHKISTLQETAEILSDILYFFRLTLHTVYESFSHLDSYINSIGLPPVFHKL